MGRGMDVHMVVRARVSMLRAREVVARTRVMEMVVSRAREVVMMREVKALRAELLLTTGACSLQLTSRLAIVPRRGLVEGARTRGSWLTGLPLGRQLVEGILGRSNGQRFGAFDCSV